MRKYKHTESTDKLLNEWGYFRPTNGADGVRNLPDEDIERLLEIGSALAERLRNNRGTLRHNTTQAIPLEDHDDE